MFNKKKNEQKEIEKIMTTTNDDITKMSYKERQKFFRKRCKLGCYSYINNGKPYKRGVNNV